MYALDTNLLVRLVVSDDLAQQRAVVERLEKAESAGDSLLVHPLVLVELSWVLAAAYRYERHQVADAMIALVETPALLISDKAEVVEAAESYRKGPADFSDYLLLALARAGGAGTLLTFDRRLLKHAHCEKP